MLYPFWVQYHYLKSNNLNIFWNLPEFLFLQPNILFPNRKNFCFFSFYTKKSCCYLHLCLLKLWRNAVTGSGSSSSLNGCYRCTDMHDVKAFQRNPVDEIAMVVRSQDPPTNQIRLSPKSMQTFCAKFDAVSYSVPELRAAAAPAEGTSIRSTVSQHLPSEILIWVNSPALKMQQTGKRLSCCFSDKMERLYPADSCCHKNRHQVEEMSMSCTAEREPKRE